MRELISKIPNGIKNILLLGVIILSVIVLDKVLSNNGKSSDGSVVAEHQTSDVLGLNEALDSLFIEAPTYETPQIPTQEIDTTINEIDSNPEIAYNEDVLQSGWVPSWATYTSIQTLSKSGVKMDYVLPVWYGVNPDGTLTDRRPSNYAQVESLAKSKGIKIMPTIALFDAEIMSQMLEGESMNTHINAIVSAVSGADYIGVDLDYESTYSKDKSRYNEFIIELSRRLKAQNKLLSITVLSKWGDNVIYTGLPQTREVQDWSFLNTYADEIRIMSYDYHSSGSLQAGPVGPIDWQRKVLTYAVSKIDRKKVWLGVHLYGYEWSTAGFTRATTGKDIPAISTIATENSYKSDVAEGFAVYPCGELQCTLYYQTQEGVKTRNKLAQEFGIAGVAYWRLGDEHDILQFTLE